MYMSARMQSDGDQSKARPVRGFKKSEGPREREESRDARNKL
jgi:hypothetical protein